MTDDSYSFATARTRLEEIVSQVRKKDTSLEKSLDLLEEGVRLANQCTELIDHADWEAAGAGDSPSGADSSEHGDGAGSEETGSAPEAGSDANTPEDDHSDTEADHG